VFLTIGRDYCSIPLTPDTYADVQFCEDCQKWHCDIVHVERENGTPSGMTEMECPPEATLEEVFRGLAQVLFSSLESSVSSEVAEIARVIYGEGFKNVLAFYQAYQVWGANKEGA